MLRRLSSVVITVIKEKGRSLFVIIKIKNLGY
jgi:hypothetical protein